MRDRTQELARRSEEMRSRAQSEGSDPCGPASTLPPATKDVLDGVCIEFRARWLLHEDSELEMAAAVANSLQEMREILVEAQKKLLADAPAREPLRRMEGVCAKFLHRHPGIDRLDFSKPVSDDELDDLFELRLEIAETVADLRDKHRLTSAQQLLAWIKFAERPSTPRLPPA